MKNKPTIQRRDLDDLIGELIIADGRAGLLLGYMVLPDGKIELKLHQQAATIGNVIFPAVKFTVTVKNGDTIKKAKIMF